MLQLSQESRGPRPSQLIRALTCAFLLLATARCGSSGPTNIEAHEVTLRVGVARFGAGSTVTGLRPIVQNLTNEGLVRIRENGRVDPWLAKTWAVSVDGLSMRIRLRPNSKFHDGSVVSADVVARILTGSLPQYMGAAFRDIDRVVAAENDLVEVRFKRPSPLLQEALETPILKPGEPGIATGPFFPATPDPFGELRANGNYYLGPPSIDRIVLTNYPTVRAAWADMLRDKVDMLYEVSADARGFIEKAASASVSAFIRPYQYMVVLNVQAPKLHSPALRRALNLAVDRAAVVRDAFDGHGLPSSGPVWPRHWSFGANVPAVGFSLQEAEKIVSSSGYGSDLGFGKQLHFTCLVPTDYERLALVVKHQLEAVGVVMHLKEVSADEAVQALGTHTFEAVLLDLVGGFGLFRTYQVWHSAGSRNLGGLGSPPMNSALDRIRHAASEDEYRKAVIAFQQFAVNDPPAIFLAWGESARAVSRRFDVAADPGRDILTTLRLWRPAGERLASRN